MRRRLFSFLSLLSLLLFLAVIGLWVHSHLRGWESVWRMAENAGDDHYNWFFAVQSSGGGLQVGRDAEVYGRKFITPGQAALATGRWKRSDRSGITTTYPRPLFGGSRSTRYGFWFLWQESHWVVRRELIVPYWFLALLTSILPAAWLWRSLRQRERDRRAAAGLCVHCGYDLRASGATCPECGTVVRHVTGSGSWGNGITPQSEKVEF